MVGHVSTVGGGSGSMPAPHAIGVAARCAADEGQSDSDAEYPLHDTGYEPPADEPATPARPPLSARADVSNTEWRTPGSAAAIAGSAKKPATGASFARARESLTRAKCDRFLRCRARPLPPPLACLCRT